MGSVQIERTELGEGQEDASSSACGRFVTSQLSQLSAYRRHTSQSGILIASLQSEVVQKSFHGHKVL